MPSDKRSVTPPVGDPMDRNGRLFAGPIIWHGGGNVRRREIWLSHFLPMSSAERWADIAKAPAPLDDPDMDAYAFIRQVCSEVEAHEVIERARKAARPTNRRPRKQRTTKG